VQGFVTSVENRGAAFYRLDATFSSKLYLNGELVDQSTSESRTLYLQRNNTEEPQMYSYTSTGSYMRDGSTCTYDDTYRYVNGNVLHEVANFQCTP